MKSLLILVLITSFGCSSMKTTTIEELVLVKSTSTIQDIVKIFGEPTEYIDSGQLRVLIYKENFYTKYSLGFNNLNEKLSVLTYNISPGEKLEDLEYSISKFKQTFHKKESYKGSHNGGKVIIYKNFQENIEIEVDPHYEDKVRFIHFYYNL